MIETTAHEMNLPLLETLVWYCEKTDMDLESAAKHITPSLKKKIEVEAAELHLVKDDGTRKLPI